MQGNQKAWITWERQRRSIELSKALDSDLYVFNYNGKLRYPKSIYKTLKVLFSKKYKIIFVQNPSMVLATLACGTKFITKKKVIVDRHSTFRLNKKRKLSFNGIMFDILHNITIKYADLTIVTNDYLADLVASKKGKPFVLPDKLPVINKTKQIEFKKDFNVFMISSIGNDEPIKDLIIAAKEIQLKSYNLYISGNFKKLDKTIIDMAPKNVFFTGFLSDEDFFNYICAVDAVIVLTTADYCMLCGCYEAVAAEKPLITSNKDVLRDYFKGCVFVDNTKVSIIEGFHEVFVNYEKYCDNVRALREEIDLKWENKYTKLLNIINILCWI